MRRLFIGLRRSSVWRALTTSCARSGGAETRRSGRRVSDGRRRKGDAHRSLQRPGPDGGIRAVSGSRRHGEGLRLHQARSTSTSAIACRKGSCSPRSKSRKCRTTSRAPRPPSKRRTPNWPPRATNCNARNRPTTWRICPTSRILDVSKQEPGLVPQQEVDEAHSRDLVAEAQVSGAKSHITACEQRIRVSQAEQARFKTVYQYAVITAPFAGVVTKRYANTGSLIQAGTASQTQAMPVVRLSENGLLRLALPVPESAVPLIHLGEPVDVRVSALNRTFPGRVARFADKVDAVHANHEDRSRRSQSDAGADSRHVRRGRSDHGAAQERALGSGGSGRRLRRLRARLSRSSRPERFRLFRSVSGSKPRSEIEIRSGDLKEGDRVVVGSRAGLKDGSKCNPR